jgi:hypothetical protein
VGKKSQKIGNTILKKCGTECLGTTVKIKIAFTGILTAGSILGMVATTKLFV